MASDRPRGERSHRERRVLVLSTIEWFTIRLARAAVLAGFRPYVATDSRFGRDRLSVHAQRRLHLERDALADGTPRALDLLNAFIERNAIDLVVAADTRCTRMLARRRDAFRGAAVFPLPPPEVLDLLDDKWSFYELLCRIGVATPRSFLATSPAWVDPAELDYPVVVKPRIGENGDGVRRLDDRDALRRHLASVARDAPMIVQEWRPGCDIGLSLCADRGELTSWLVQRREVNGMRFLDDARAVAFGRAICRATRYHGVAHIDMRLDERTGDVVAIEFNPRFWGSVDYATWMGVNFLVAGALLLEARRAPAVRPDAVGFCPYLGSTPGGLLRWACRGFDPPVRRAAQLRAWRMQMLDPLPEWTQWTAAHVRDAFRRSGP